MKSDTIIIGGGLTGLVAGIRLSSRGKRVIMISSGQSALHFSSGSMELLGAGPDAIKTLDENHPYTIVGAERSLGYARDFAALLADAGVKTGGDTSTNHYRITPIGEIKPAWLTLADYPTLAAPDAAPWKRVALLNLQGYLDLFPRFVTRAFDRLGVEVVSGEFSLPELESMRRSPSEMRATNMARVLTGDVLPRLAAAINAAVKESVDAIMMPAVVGLFDSEPVEMLRSMVKAPLYFLPTIPTSVPGVRTQIMLRKRFQQLGGIYLLGDKVTAGEFDASGRLRCVTSANMGRECLEADNFILATGGFFSHGLTATPSEVTEPVLHLDVDAPDDRTLWLSKDFYGPQPFMSFGVRHDASFRALRGGKVVPNLYVAGPIAGGCDAMALECGAGVSAVTAMAVADDIIQV